MNSRPLEVERQINAALGSMIRARLDRARELGFSVAYPKVVMRADKMTRLAGRARYGPGASTI